jgi:hypothetical protein
MNRGIFKISRTWILVNDILFSSIFSFTLFFNEFDVNNFLQTVVVDGT